jgi:hypothetical protein
VWGGGSVWTLLARSDALSNRISAVASQPIRQDGPLVCLFETPGKNNALSQNVVIRLTQNPTLFPYKSRREVYTSTVKWSVNFLRTFVYYSFGELVQYTIILFMIAMLVLEMQRRKILWRDWVTRWIVIFSLLSKEQIEFSSVANKNIIVPRACRNVTGMGLQRDVIYLCW